MDVVAKFEGDYKFLSNFHMSDVEVKILGDRMRFRSGEHAFQAMKANYAPNEVEGREHALRCSKINTPGQVKQQGQRIRIDLPLWESGKDDAMRQVVFSKFLLNPDLRARLLDTKTAMLVEGNDWNDTYWGRCDGKGLNRLGAILMETRGFWFFSGKNHAAPLSEQSAHILMGW